MKSEFEETIEQAERNAANERISEGGISLPTMLGVVENAWDFLDVISRADVERRRVAGAPIPACREGYSHCCSLRVTAAPLEILALGLHLRETLAPEALAALVARLSKLAPEVVRTDSFRWAARNISCPLLKDGRCSVYALRPLNCRGWNSFRLLDCEKVVGNPHQEIEQAEYVRVGSVWLAENQAVAEIGSAAGHCFPALRKRAACGFLGGHAILSEAGGRRFRRTFAVISRGAPADEPQRKKFGPAWQAA